MLQRPSNDGVATIGRRNARSEIAFWPILPARAHSLMMGETSASHCSLSASYTARGSTATRPAASSSSSFWNLACSAGGTSTGAFRAKLSLPSRWSISCWSSSHVDWSSRIHSPTLPSGAVNRTAPDLRRRTRTRTSGCEKQSSHIVKVSALRFTHSGLMSVCFSPSPRLTAMTRAVYPSCGAAMPRPKPLARRKSSNASCRSSNMTCADTRRGAVSTFLGAGTRSGSCVMHGSSGFRSTASESGTHTRSSAGSPRWRIVDAPRAIVRRSMSVFQ
mmetsp:Transcript_31677/g.97943  ORF Transcript_31677/g.97943 Transcript_31677/m.97943 type:complete len:275 (-) Transcript_31677:130-954(-)